MQPPPSELDPQPLRYGASIAVFKGDAVLLIKRGHAPACGLWSLPGGKFEEGENPRETALRELAEETGTRADIAGVLDVIEVAADGAGGEKLRYRLTVFYGRHLAAEPVAGSDAADARWVKLSALEDELMTKETAVLIRVAAKRLGLSES